MHLHVQPVVAYLLKNVEHAHLDGPQRVLHLSVVGLIEDNALRQPRQDVDPGGLDHGW